MTVLKCKSAPVIRIFSPNLGNSLTSLTKFAQPPDSIAGQHPVKTVWGRGSRSFSGNSQWSSKLIDYIHAQVSPAVEQAGSIYTPGEVVGPPVVRASVTG
jgi:hypothetical protein